MRSRRWLCIHVVPVFQPGDPPPTGYIEWHEWARVQLRAGIRQKRCLTCKLWKFPNERCACTTPPREIEVKLG